MNQLNQIGIDVVSNNDLLKSQFHRETSIAGAVAMLEKEAPHDVNKVVYRSFCKFRFARGLLGGERRRVAPEVTAQQAARRWV